MGALARGGAMAAVFAPAEQVEAAVERHPLLSIAAYNGAHTVVSGPAEAVEEVMAELTKQGVRCQRLNTSQAFHSALIEPALEEFEAFAASVEFQPAARTLISNLTGRPLAGGQVLDAASWRRHAREPVQFGQSVQSLADLGCSVLLEIGPQPVLCGMAAASWPNAEQPTLVASLRRGQPDTPTLMRALAELYIRGATPDFAAFDAPWPRRKLALPTYPFQRQHYWIETRRRPLSAHGQPVHPLLGASRSRPPGKWFTRRSLAARSSRG